MQIELELFHAAQGSEIEDLVKQLRGDEIVASAQRYGDRNFRRFVVDDRVQLNKPDDRVGRKVDRADDRYPLKIEAADVVHDRRVVDRCVETLNAILLIQVEIVRGDTGEIAGRHLAEFKGAG